MVKNLSKRWTLGLIMLTVVIVLWVLSSFLINIIFEDDIYRKPFFITYFNTASFIFYLLPTMKNTLVRYKNTGEFRVHEELILEEEGLSRKNSALFRDPEQLIASTSNNSGPTSNYDNIHNRNKLDNNTDLATVESSLLPRDETDIDVDRLSLRDTIKLSAQFCILWFLANFATNASLAYTSVASQTMLSSTSSFFTLFIGAMGNVETVTKPKVLGSILSFLGIALVTQSDSLQAHLPIKPAQLGDDSNTWHTLTGNLLAIAGAMFYGIYSTLLKIKVRDESKINMKIFFGFVGLCTLLFMWPSLLLLHYLGWERFELPTKTNVIIIILLNTVITFVSDFCWAKAMLLTSPLTVTVGLSITIPVAMFGDILFKHKSMPPEYLLGGLLILGSFFIISKNSEEEGVHNEAQLLEAEPVQD